MRMIKQVTKDRQDAVQILLFSATFDESVKHFAQNAVGGKANKVSCYSFASCHKQCCALPWSAKSGQHINTWVQHAGSATTRLWPCALLDALSCSRTQQRLFT